MKLTTLLRQSGLDLAAVAALFLPVSLCHADRTPAVDSHRVLKGGSQARFGAQPLTADYALLPLSFESNRGQCGRSIQFLTRGPGYGLWLTSQEAIFTLQPQPARPAPLPSPPGAHRPAPSLLCMRLVGSNALAAADGEEALPGKVGYFEGSDPGQWRTNIATFRKVAYRSVYPGVDLVYYGNHRQLEYDFNLAPRADPSRIALTFAGARRIRVDGSSGDLVISIPGGDVRWRKPLAYQVIAGKRRIVPARYVLQGRGEEGYGNRESRRDAIQNRTVGFALASYDASKPLIIDPSLLYSTFLGGPGFDAGRGIAIDPMGSAYITGYTTSVPQLDSKGNVVAPGFPTTLTAFQIVAGGGPQGNGDAFVTKLDPTGKFLVYSTYLGGAGDDGGQAIAVNALGNAFVTGYTTSANFPTVAPYQGALTGTEDAFVTEISVDGMKLVYSTYVGLGNSGYGITLDAAGDAYLAGQATLSIFTPPSTFTSSVDAFVAEMSPTGAGIVFSTYLGSNGTTIGYGIALDTQGFIYVTGSATDPLAATFTTPGAFQPTYNGGGHDAFVAKVNPAPFGGNPLVYLTFLGGEGDDQGLAIAVDFGGHAYVTGVTNSLYFPATPNALQPNNKGISNAFVTRLSADGSSAIYSTYLGGAGTDFGTGIAVDTAGDAFVTGGTAGGFPATPGAYQQTDATNAGAPTEDAFVAALNTTGTGILYGTYLGGPGNDFGAAIAIDSTGDVFVTGSTSSGTFPTPTNPLPGRLPGYSQTNAGGTDAFVLGLQHVYRPFDFNGDGQPDLILQDFTADTAAVWYLNGAQVLRGAFFNPPPPPGWQIGGAADFNGDGKPDLVLQNLTTGQVAIWYMNGLRVVSGVLVGNPGPQWLVVGIGDFNGDGYPDLVLQNQSTGLGAIWYTNGTSVTSGAYVSVNAGPNWRIAGVGDFNQDGHPDLVLQNQITNAIAIWTMNGATVTNGTFIGGVIVPLGFQVEGVYDFNGDGFPDLMLQQLTTGFLVEWLMNGTNVVSGAYLSGNPGRFYQVAAPH